jgi:hypothetical protein
MNTRPSRISRSIEDAIITVTGAYRTARAASTEALGDCISSDPFRVKSFTQSSQSVPHPVEKFISD